MTDLPADPQPDTNADGPLVDNDDGAALERAAESIRDAKEAEGGVAAHGDLAGQDDERAQESSEDPPAL